MIRSNPYIDAPLTITRIVYMIYCTVIYLSQVIYGSIRGFLWFTLGKKDDRKRELFHNAIWKHFNIDMEYSPFWKTTIHNPYKEDFKKGSILICNHQSMLDTLCLLVLSPRVLIVTHDKVWNNPIIAAVLRYADFISVTDTQWEDRFDYCKSFLDKGYSIAIFPEAQRSVHGNILRFHKGAFYLAEKLKADILPVFIHGAAHVLPTGVSFANKGKLYIEIGERIAYKDDSFGKNYVERCKRFHLYYIDYFESIRNKIETPDYFRDLVISLYSSVGLEKEVKEVLIKGKPDRWGIDDLIMALTNPLNQLDVSKKSHLRLLYNKFTNLPSNIKFI